MVARGRNKRLLVFLSANLTERLDARNFYIVVLAAHALDVHILKFGKFEIRNTFDNRRLDIVVVALLKDTLCKRKHVAAVYVEQLQDNTVGIPEVLFTI